MGPSPDIPEPRFPKLPPGWPAPQPEAVRKTREELLRQRLTGERTNPRRRRITQIRRDLTIAITALGKDGVYRLKVRRQGLSGRQWVRLRKELNKEYHRRMKEQP